MDCRETDRGELAEKYLSGKLDPAHQDEFEVHILECSKCLQAVEALDLIRNDLAERAHLLRGQTSGQRAWFRWQWVAVVSVTLIVGGLVLRRPLQVSHAPPQPAQNSVPGEESPFDRKISLSGEHRDITAVTKSAPPGRNTLGLSAQRSSAARDRSLVTTRVAFEQELARLSYVEPPPPFSYNGPVSRDYALTPSLPALDAGQDLFRKAMDAYRQRNYDTSARLLEGAMQADPQAADTKFFLGICLLMLGKPTEAVVPLTAASEDEPAPISESAHFYLAKAYVRLADLAKAEVELRKAAALPGERHTEAHLMLAQLQALRALQKDQAKKPVSSTQGQKAGRGR